MFVERTCKDVGGIISIPEGIVQERVLQVPAERSSRAMFVCMGLINAPETLHQSVFQVVGAPVVLQARIGLLNLARSFERRPAVEKAQATPQSKRVWLGKHRPDVL